MTERPLKISIFSFDLPSQACAQLRLLLPLFQFRDQVEFAWEVKNNGTKYMLSPDAGRDADLLILQRGFPSPETVEIMEDLLNLGKPLIYEVDDDLLHLPDSHPLLEKAEASLEAVTTLARQARGITVSTSVLAQTFADLNPKAWVLPNLILEQAFPDSARPVRPTRGPVVVVYAGTVTHAEDLDLLEEPMRRIAERHGQGVLFKFYGCEPKFLPGPIKAQCLPFDQDYLSYVRRLPRLGGHIALAPLKDNPFNRAKSNIKWLEYSACGLAGVYADLPPYADCVVPGETGLLAGPDPEAWFEALDELVSDPVRRLNMAAQAREAALSGYSLAARAGEFLACWREAAGRSC